jgi:transposase
MLGPPKPRRLDEPVAVSLENLVPTGHFYRHLEAKLDLGFVREWARELYADRGRPSVDPVVFFKLQLVMFFEGVRSERKLVETASLNLAHRWYLGYALDESLPDHSSLTRIRQRLGVAIFERFFETVVDLCQEVGLVWGKELYFDATKVEANADLDTLVPRFYRAAKLHVDDLFAAQPSEDGGRAAPAPPEDEAPAGVTRLPGEHPAPGARPWRLLEARRLDPQRPLTRGYDRMSGWLVSTTDPDATPMRTGARSALGYHDHYVVDGGKARIVLAALVTPADVMENAPMRDLLWRVRFRRKLRPHHVTGDATYGTLENIAGVEREGIRIYVPLVDFEHRTPFFGRDAFAFDAERDAYRCPERPGTAPVRGPGRGRGRRLPG